MDNLKFDECNQPYRYENGIKYYGCPGCGAAFKESCFCGMCNETSEDDYINEVLNDLE